MIPRDPPVVRDRPEPAVPPTKEHSTDRVEEGRVLHQKQTMPRFS